MAKKNATTTTNVTQSSISTLAAQALRKRDAQLLRLPVRLIGETPILMHRWSQKALLMMLGKMVGIDMPKVAKDLTNDYEQSWYRNVNGVLALPCRIIKASIVEGAIATGKVVSKAELKRSLRVLGYTTPITIPKGKEMYPDVSIVRTSGMSKAPDVRARAVIPAGWTADIVLQFPKTLSVDKVISALVGAGNAVGLCDFRMEKGGDFGAFDIEVLESQADIKRILKACAVPEEQPDIPPEYMRAFNAHTEDEQKEIEKKVPAMKGATRSKKKVSKRSTKRANGAAASA